MYVRGGEAVWFLRTSSLDTWQASHFGCFTSRETSRYAMDRRLCDCQIRSGHSGKEKHSNAITRNRSLAVQSVHIKVLRCSRSSPESLKWFFAYCHEIESSVEMCLCHLLAIASFTKELTARSSFFATPTLCLHGVVLTHWQIRCIKISHKLRYVSYTQFPYYHNYSVYGM